MYCRSFAAALALAVIPALAQTINPAPSAEIPMQDYLGLLAQMAPAAHGGARAFLDAHRRHCGRDLTSAELRVALAAGQGDPVLVAMIRASHLDDQGSLTTLATQVRCRRALP